MRRLHQLRAALGKETLALIRDTEALLILIVMPAVFVLIMSLALQDTFSHQIPKPMRLVLLDRAHTTFAPRLAATLRKNPSLAVSVQKPANDRAGRAHVRELVHTGRVALAVVLSKPRPGRGHRSRVRVTLYTNPALPAQMRALGISLVRQAMARLDAARLASALQRLVPRGSVGTPSGLTVLTQRPARLVVAKRGLNGAPTPTSAQQNAPAWALLAMFFLAVPLSVSLIKERQQGVLLRLRALPVPSWVLLTGKILPYFVINMIQLAVVLLEGMYLLPLLGGDALNIGHAPLALGVIAAAANLAAIGYGLLVATVVRTQEQATSFGAVSVLIMAAIGGILVPKMVMPAAMQRLAVISPMSWGLDGFQAIFVRGDGLTGILPDAWHLIGFGTACLMVAAVRFRHELRPQ
ncbi:MAG: ABC transporter permease [Acidiferrobacter sp.]